eukprot:8636808-Pyramimonas_sp.AAC.1
MLKVDRTALVVAAATQALSETVARRRGPLGYENTLQAKTLHGTRQSFVLGHISGLVGFGHV